MILEITQLGNPVLRKKCKPVTEVTEDVKTLAANMVETMIDAEGVGIAAPQVGVAVRMAVVDVAHDPECLTFCKINGEDVNMPEHMPLVFINPELELSGEKVNDMEGCLSIDEIRGNVKRPTIVKAKLELLDGSVIELEADGLLARALQHEVDHLNGVLFIDRISAATKARLRKRLKLLAEEGQP